MICVNLCGGVGNQLFQVATGVAIAKEYKSVYGIDYNLQHNLVQGYPSRRYKDNLFSMIPEIDIGSVHHTFYQEPSWEYTELPKFNGHVFLNGYFQSEKYFKNHGDEICELLQFPADIIDKIDAVVSKLKEHYDKLILVHARRGDYIKYNKVHAVQPSEYYQSAMKALESDNCCYVVISDDIDWCQQHLNGENITFSNPHDTGIKYDELCDLYLASKCDDYVISNSSFSWWGAYLNRSNTKRVIAPSTWFGPDGPTQNWSDVYCENWEVM